MFVTPEAILKRHAGTAMISQNKINQAVKLLISAAHPVRIIVFGSHGRGDASDESDLDLLVIVPEVKNKYKEMVRLRRVLRPLRIPVDVLVYSENEVDEWAHLPGTALYWALKEGRVVHEATH